MEKFIVYEYTEKASPEYQGSRFMTLFTGEVQDRANAITKIVAQDVSEAEAYRLVNEVEDRNIDAYIKSLPKELMGGKSEEFIRNLLKGGY